MASRIADTAGSRISSVAVGEARISGIVEPAELLLSSPLQSVPCVYYRSTVEQDENRSSRTIFREERAVGFRVRDDSGSMRVFPRGARWAIGERLRESTSMFGEQPANLELRVGPAVLPGSPDRDAAVERLLTVRDPNATDPALALLRGSGHRRYREARIEPGDTVTIVGFVEPFEQLPDPAGADDASFDDAVTADPLADPAIAADLAAARAVGELAATPDEAWGNAAIPGFGIGRPVRTPILDAGADRPPLADAATAARIERTFTIRPDELILAATPGVPLLVTLGAPAQAAAREDGRFLLGLLGAVLAIASAVAVAAVLGGIVA
jgi:hypothetical protein